MPPSPIHRSVCLLFTASLLAGCTAQSSTPTQAEPSPASSPTPAATPTKVTPTPPTSPTRRPTATPVRLNQEPSWAVTRDDTGVWISNPDGRARTQILERGPESYAEAPFAISPDGLSLAVSSLPIGPSPESSLYTLRVLALPPGEIVWEVPLFSEKQLDYIMANLSDSDEADPYGNPALYARAQVWAALAMRDSLAWSPNGSYLAFIAAIDGPSSDLYLLDMSSGQVHRLSSGPLQAGHILWSPDSRYVLHNSVSDYNVGRSGSDTTDALWSVEALKGPPQLLIQGPAFPLAWLTPQHVLASMWLWYCDTYNFMIIDVPRARYSTIWRGPLVVDWTSDTDFTLELPPQVFDTEGPPFADCVPPSNEPAAVDMKAIPSLPSGAFTSAQPSSLRITVHEGFPSYDLLPPTPTPTAIPTPSPRAPAEP